MVPQQRDRRKLKLTHRGTREGRCRRNCLSRKESRPVVRASQPIALLIPPRPSARKSNKPGAVSSAITKAKNQSKSNKGPLLYRGRMQST